MTRLKTFETLDRAVDDFKKNAGVLIGASAISSIVTALAVGVGVLALSAGGGTAALIAVTALNLVVMTFFSIGMVGLSLKVVRGQQPKIADLFAHGSSLPRALTSLISTLILGFGATAPLAFIPSVGPVLWILAAMFILSLTCLAPFYLVDKKQGPLRAMWSSAKDTNGNRLAVMGLVFLSALLTSVSGILPVIGPFIATSIGSLAMAHAYTTVAGEGSAQSVAPRVSMAPPEPPIPAVSDAKVESTLQQFEDELRADGKLAN